MSRKIYENGEVKNISGTVADATLSETSKNPVQNKVVTEKLNQLNNNIGRLGNFDLSELQVISKSLSIVVNSGITRGTSAMWTTPSKGLVICSYDVYDNNSLAGKKFGGSVTTSSSNSGNPIYGYQEASAETYRINKAFSFIAEKNISLYPYAYHEISGRTIVVSANILFIPMS